MIGRHAFLFPKIAQPSIGGVFAVFIVKEWVMWVIELKYMQNDIGLHLCTMMSFLGSTALSDDFMDCLTIMHFLSHRLLQLPLSGCCFVSSMRRLS